MNRDVLPEKRRAGFLGRRGAHAMTAQPPTAAPASLSAAVLEAQAAWAAEHDRRLELEREVEELRGDRARLHEVATQAQGLLDQARRQVLATPLELEELRAELYGVRARLAEQRTTVTAERDARARVEAELTTQLCETEALRHREQELLRVVQDLRAELGERSCDPDEEHAVERAVAMVAELTAERVELVARVAHAEDAHRRAVVEIDRATGQAEHALQEAATGAARAAQAEGELAALRVVNQELEAALRGADMRAEGLRSEVDQVLLGELDEARSELAKACEDRDAMQGRVVRLERDLERARNDRDFVHARITALLPVEAELASATADLLAAREEAERLRQAQEELVVCHDAASRDFAQTATAAHARIDELEALLASQPQGTAAVFQVPIGKLLVSEAEWAARDNQVRQLDQRRAAEAQARAAAEASLEDAQRMLAQATSQQRAAQQRHAEVSAQYDRLARNVVELQGLADVTARALGLPAMSVALLSGQVQDRVDQLRRKVQQAESMLAVREAELDDARAEAVRPQVQPAAPSRPSAETVDVTADSPRAMRLLAKLREATAEDAVV